MFVFGERKREVYVKSTYNDVRLLFGKTKVKEINAVCSSSVEVERMYYLSNPYKFYEEKIKSSEYYNSKLEFKGKYDDTYGYLIKDEATFKYKILDKYITLSTIGSRWTYLWRI